MHNKRTNDSWVNNPWRRFFSFFHNSDTVYLDNAGTTLKPLVTIEAISNYYNLYSVNLHSSANHYLFQETQKKISHARILVAKKIGILQTDEIIFTPSATYALNLLAMSLENCLKDNEKLCLTYLEHSSNCYPFEMLAKRCGARVSFLPLSEGTIEIEKLSEHIDQTTKIVSFAHTNNNLGTTQDVCSITRQIKKINPNCIVVLDCCQSVPHSPILAEKWEIDALVFSAHKVYGPTGLGVMWIRKKVADKLTDVIWGGGKTNHCSDINLPIFRRWEVGTLPLAQIFGLAASLEWLDSFDVQQMWDYEKQLTRYALMELKKLKEVILYTNIESATSIVLFNIKKHHAHDVVEYLCERNVIVRAGDFCSPYLEKIINTKSALRASFSFYNTKHDIDTLIKCVTELIEFPELIFNPIIPNKN